MGKAFESSCGREASGLVAANNRILNCIYRQIAESADKDMNGSRSIKLRSHSRDLNRVSPVKRFILDSFVSAPVIPWSCTGLPGH